MKLLLLAFLVPLTATWAAASEPVHIMLPATTLEPKGIELFVAAPSGAGRRPVILFVHGHQSPPRPGGRVFVHLHEALPFGTQDQGRLAKMSAQGYLAASVSLPGYGGTAGPPDFCGPRSQAAVQEAIDYLLTQPDADKRKVVVYGVSRGATTAGMEAARDPRVTGLILVSGIYDLAAAYPSKDPAINRNIQEEAGTTPADLAERSVLLHASKIHARVLILHGSADGMAGQAKQLAAALQANGTPVTLRVFDHTPHSIPIAVQWSVIDPFLASPTSP